MGPPNKLFFWFYLILKVLEGPIWPFLGFIFQPWDPPKIVFFIVFDFFGFLGRFWRVQPAPPHVSFPSPGTSQKLIFGGFYEGFGGSNIPFPSLHILSLGPPKNSSFYFLFFFKGVGGSNLPFPRPRLLTLGVPKNSFLFV